MSKTDSQTTQSQQIDERWLQFDQLYAAGAYRELSRFHIYKDCHHIQYSSSSEPRTATVNAIKFHELRACSDCKKRAISYITSSRRKEPPRNSRSIRVRPQERKYLDALVSAHVLKDRTTGVRASLYELQQMVRDGKVPTQFKGDSDESAQLDDSQDTVIYTDLYPEDIRLANELVEEHGFTTPNEVYRTALVLYINALTELDLKTHIENIDTDVDLDIGIYDEDGLKPIGEISTPTE